MIISIDPSINQTGYAVIRNGKVVASGVIRARGKNDAEKLAFLFKELQKIHRKYRFSRVILEKTDFFPYRKHINSWNNKPLNIKSLCKLNKAIGVVELFCSLNNISLTELTPEQWKGKLSKEVIKILTGKKNHNEAEAVLMGLLYND